MNTTTPTPRRYLPTPDTGRTVDRLGSLLACCGVIAALAWIGAMKFTAEEAAAIEPLVSGSPLMSWLYDVADLRTVSAAIGVIELVTATLLLLGIRSARAGVAGGLLATGTFLLTLSFLVTSTSYAPTPPFLSPGGSFLIKDLALLGASLMILGRSWVRLTTR
ncbi:DUF417 family protein [Nocardia huaxiensis]|uniref:DUF417 family protein n=1 Tax=Nocardia huaxiensis TaxID=2755382 RepID=A0A7D6V8X6_9NOCA|nr:DUF417 family protein [Nocardia huaxiensis]QLY29233.1 DUF417 family protein [Nocardia huaxiensis]UFS97266.1 DUF417 family protein [Nocardia huaxiensis]